MVLKMRSFSFVLFLMVPFSGVVHSEEITGIYGEPVSLNQDGTTSNNVYYGSGYDPSSPNLLIGGIGQNSPDPTKNDAVYRKVADNNHAIYVPTYFTGYRVADATAVNEAARSSEEYPEGASYLNGLTSPALNNADYGTIIAYSGGTTSVVTAMANQGVTADTLILISPMRGGAGRAETGKIGWDERVDFDWDVEFEQKIQAILNAGTKIVIIQSNLDIPPFGFFYQYKFTEDEWPKDRWPGLTIHDENLDLFGNTHWEIFSEYATNIINGEYMPETALEEVEKPDLAATLGVPLLWPSNSDIARRSDQGLNWQDSPGDLMNYDGLEEPPETPCFGDDGLPCI